MSVRPLITRPFSGSFHRTAMQVGLSGLGAVDYVPIWANAFTNSVINDPVHKKDWETYGEPIPLSLSKIKNNASLINGPVRLPVGMRDNITGVKKSVPGTDLIAGAAFGDRLSTPSNPRLYFYLYAPDGATGQAFPKSGVSLYDTIKAGDFYVSQGNKDSFLKSFYQDVKSVARSAIKVALKPVVYVATAPLNIIPATKPIASKINTAIINNPLTTAAILAAATGVTLATAPTAAATAAPTAAPATATITQVAPASVAATTPALSTAATVAAPVAASTVIPGAATITGAGISSFLPTLAKTAAVVAPAYISAKTAGGAGGGNFVNTPPAPVDANAAAPGTLPKWAVPAMLGAGALLLAFINS